MKKNGFTLIEIIATIAIMLIITVIAVPSTVSLLTRGKEKSHTLQIEEFETAAESFIIDNKHAYNIKTISGSDSIKCATLSDLTDNNYIKEIPNDPLTDKLFTGYVKIENVSNKLVYTYTEEGTCDSANSIFAFTPSYTEEDEGIDISDDGGEIPIYSLNVDGSGASEPDLFGELIPVVYDYNNKVWIKADTTKNWYNYEEQMWANAVNVRESGSISKSSYQTASAGTIIHETDILNMWVWIPRFHYKIESTYAGGTISQPGAINIEFDSNLNNTLSGDAVSSHCTHPAFNFDGGNVTGIWVGKFLTSKEGSSVYTVKMNSTDLLDISTEYYISGMDESEFGITTTTTPDIHVIKNTEWGAVAYLFQSNYGKYGNNKFSDSQKKLYSLPEITIGVSGTSDEATYVQTGCSNGGINISYKFCPYEYDEKYYGEGASTTGNVYGVYDLVYTQAVAGGSWLNSTFLDKYFNKYYTYSSRSGNTCGLPTIEDNNLYPKYINGDATEETNKWYDGNGFNTNESNPTIAIDKISDYSAIREYNICSGDDHYYYYYYRNNAFSFDSTTENTITDYSFHVALVNKD